MSSRDVKMILVPFFATSQFDRLEKNVQSLCVRIFPGKAFNVIILVCHGIKRRHVLPNHFLPKKVYYSTSVDEDLLKG